MVRESPVQVKSTTLIQMMQVNNDVFFLRITNIFNYATNQVSIQTIHTMPGVGIVAWLGLLIANIVHDLVLSLARNL